MHMPVWLIQQRWQDKVHTHSSAVTQKMWYPPCSHLNLFFSLCFFLECTWTHTTHSTQSSRHVIISERPLCSFHSSIMHMFLSEMEKNFSSMTNVHRLYNNMRQAESHMVNVDYVEADKCKFGLKIFNWGAMVWLKSFSEKQLCRHLAGNSTSSENIDRTVYLRNRLHNSSHHWSTKRPHLQRSSNQQNSTPVWTHKDQHQTAWTNKNDYGGGWPASNRWNIISSSPELN